MRLLYKKFYRQRNGALGVRRKGAGRWLDLTLFTYRFLDSSE